MLKSFQMFSLFYNLVHFIIYPLSMLIQFFVVFLQLKKDNKKMKDKLMVTFTTFTLDLI